jgi:hypothetical protein
MQKPKTRGRVVRPLARRTLVEKKIPGGPILTRTRDLGDPGALIKILRDAIERNDKK